MSQDTPQPKGRQLKIQKGRYKTFATAALKEKGHTLLGINWKSRTIHYLDENNNKKVRPVWGLPAGV